MFTAVLLMVLFPVQDDISELMTHSLTLHVQRTDVFSLLLSAHVLLDVPDLTQ